MKNKKITYNNNIQKKYLSPVINKNLNKKYSKILDNIIINLDTKHDALHTLSKIFKFNFKIKDLKKFDKYKVVAIIGVGGSILGSQAINSFLKKKSKKIFLFFNDIDKNIITKLKSKKKLNKILFIVISKSGNTIETLSNFLILKIIKKNSQNIIIISKKNNNPLHILSKKMNLHYIEHKDYIGGRYSIFSEVGMVPAYLMGVNFSRFRKNLQNPLKINKNFLKESSIILSNLLKNNKFRNLILFNYIPELDNFLFWCQQLIAESLGKRGKGFLPVISKAPKDHHSLLQLYLDGPKDKIFYIFSEEIKGHKKEKIKTKNLDKRINFLNNKSLDQIKEAQKSAFIKSLKNKNIPFREFKIRDFNDDTLGELFSYFMLETAIIGKLTNIDPFNQPAVEQVKIDTNQLLI